MKHTTLLLFAAIAALGHSSASAQTVGDWILGNYKKAGYWFPGGIETIEGERITIRYDDGDREIVGREDVRAYDWVIGRKVECNYEGAGHWYPGTIVSLGGERIGIAYDDGDREVTRTGRCRSR